MLKLMRDKFHHLKWVLMAVVVAFILGFVFFDMGLGGAVGASETRSFAARVNGDPISYVDFDRALASREMQFRQMYREQFTPEMAAAMGLHRQVLDELVDAHLMLQEARRLNLEATPEELRRQILAIPDLNPNGRFVGADDYNTWVQSNGYPNAAAFEDELRRMITLRKMESALSNSIVISPKSAEAEFRRNSESAKIRYVLYPAMREAALVTVTDADVKAYYQANLAKYSHAEQRNLKYLVADLSRLRLTIQPTEQEMRQRYEASKENFKRQESARILHILIKADQQSTPEQVAAAEAKAKSLVAQLRAGADFGALAQANSQDPSSAGNGGDMGFIERGMTVEPFDTAAFSIPLNTISDPIRSTEYGFHIIKVLERRAAGYAPFEEVREQIRQLVVTEKAQTVAKDEMARIATQLRNKKPANAQEFGAYANERVSSNDTQWFQKTEQVPGLGFNQPLNNWAFSAKQGDISDTIGTQRGPAILYVAGIRPAGTSPLEEIRARVETDARNAKARDVARQKLAAAMASGASLDAVAAAVGVPAAETTINRTGFIQGIQGDTAALVEAVMASNVNEVKGPVIAGDGAVVYQVTEQKKVTPEELAQNRAALIDAMRQREARSLRAALLQRLRKTADVEVNEEVLRLNTTAAPAQPAGI